MDIKKLIAISSLFISVCLLLGYLIMLFHVWRLVGSSTLSHCSRLTREIHKHDNRVSRIRNTINIAFLISMILFIRFFQSNYSISQIGEYWFACVLFFMTVSTSVIQGMPSMVVFLGPGNINSRSLQSSLDRRLYPLRVISFLEALPFSKFHNGNNSFRLEGTQNWMETVRKFILSCPLVVIDWRAPTENVSAELNLINATGSASKAVCLVGPESPVLPANIASVMSEKALFDLLFPILVGKAKMPSQKSPLKDRVI